MLSTLVGLPAAWIYYGPLPPQAQQVANRLVSVAKEALGWDGRAEEVEPGETWVHAAATPAGRASEASSSGAPQPAAPAQARGPVVEPKPLSFAERVEPLLARLRQFGVAEYALERWGNDGDLYRFRCEMPLSPHVELTQQFEAVAADPQLSVEQVVAEVATWRLAQRGGGL
jgi:hypothetical protein